MKLPFTKEQFLEVFGRYNTDVYPLQTFFLLLAVITMLIVYKGNRKQQKIILGISGACWLWMGAVYHIGYFSVINKAAYIFGFLFIVQSIFLLHYAFKKEPIFVFRGNIQSIVSSLMVFYSLIVYPLIAHFAGHGYPYSPTFGLPCPTTIFTLALFLLAKPRLPLYMAVIPIIWSVIGFTAAFSLGIYEDTFLIISGFITAVFYLGHAKRRA